MDDWKSTVYGRLWVKCHVPKPSPSCGAERQNSGTTAKGRKCISAESLQSGQKETSSSQSFHRSCYDINNGARPFCFDRAYQSATAARVHPLKHRLLQTLNYWVAPAAHLSRPTNSFISPCAACLCTASLPKTNQKKNKNMWGCTGNLWGLSILRPRWKCNMSVRVRCAQCLQKLIILEIK